MPDEPHDHQTLLYFDRLLPADQDHFSPKELAGVIDVSPDYVRAAVDSGSVHGYTLNSRKTAGSEKREYRTYRIPRTFAVLWLAKTATFNLADLTQEITQIIQTLPKSARRQLYIHLAKNQ